MMNNAQFNPFNSDTFGNFSQLFPGSDIPGALDVKAVMSTYEKNIEALSESGKTAYHGTQSLLENQGEKGRRSLESVLSSIQALSAAKSPQQALDCSTDIAKNLYQSFLADFWDVTDLAAKTTTKSLGTINRRVGESLDEMKSYFDSTPVAKKAPAKKAQQAT